MIYSTKELFYGMLDNKKVYRFHYFPISTPFVKPLQLKPVLCLIKDETPIGFNCMRKIAYLVDECGTVSEKGNEIRMDRYCADFCDDYFADNYDEAVKKYNELVNKGVSMFNKVAKDLEKERIS